ncbi:MAG: glycosyltransferase [Methyloprofundus sp.]|nr:glycosyltransferase [Methyloprofundus sp.]
MISLQILICTHNRVALLQRTIDYLNKVARPDNYDIKIFVAANACTDNTCQYLNNYQQSAKKDELPLEWIAEPTPGKSNALNSAIPKLNASIIAMVDDDHRIDDNYLIAISSAVARHPEADFFCGKIIPDWDGNEPSWVHEQGKYRIYPLPVPRFELGEQSIRVTRKIAVPGGGNLVIKKELFGRIGNFSTEFGPVGHNLGGAEDIEWVIRAYQSGALLQYIPEIVQYHYVESERMTLAYVIKKAYERSSSTVRLNEEAKNFTGLFPRYLLRKFIEYFMHSLFSVSNSARRFYLVRLAASAGEIKGFLMAKPESI